MNSGCFRKRSTEPVRVWHPQRASRVSTHRRGFTGLSNGFVDVIVGLGYSDTLNLV